MTEAEIQKILAYLCKVQRDVNRYDELNPQGGIPLDFFNLKDVKPASKEVQEKWEAARKAREAEREKVRGVLPVHLIRLYKVVCGLFDAMEDTKDTEDFNSLWMRLMGG